MTLASFETVLVEKSYSRETIKAYLPAVSRFLGHVGSRSHLKNASSRDRIQNYLNFRLGHDEVSPSTYMVELNALLFYYRNVLHEEIRHVKELRQKKVNIPIILNPEQVQALFKNIPFDRKLPFKLVYGVGITMNECLRIRLGDIDLTKKCIRIRTLRGGEGRFVSFPETLFTAITRQYNNSMQAWRADHAADTGVFLPRPLESRFKKIGYLPEWYWLFPHATLTLDHHSRRTQRNHIDEFILKREFTKARKALSLPDTVSIFTLIDSFAVHFIQGMFTQGYSHYEIRYELKKYIGRPQWGRIRYYFPLAQPSESAVKLPIDSLR